MLKMRKSNNNFQFNLEQKVIRLFKKHLNRKLYKNKEIMLKVFR